MPTIECACGARYRVPDEAVGKRVRCKKCNSVFKVAPPAAEPDVFGFAASDLNALASGTAVERPVGSSGQTAPLAVPIQLALADNPAVVVQEPGVARIPWKPYLLDLWWSLLVLRHPGSLVVFLILATLTIVPRITSAMVCFGWIANLIVMAWVMAYQFRVIAGAADREEELPDLIGQDSFVSDVIAPLFRMLMTRIAASLPAAVFITSLNLRDGVLLQDTILEFLMICVGLFDPVMNRSGTEAVVGWMLVCAGLLLWPMFLMMVALGGVGTLVRLDLLLVTIARTFPGYLVAAFVTYLGVLSSLLLTTPVTLRIMGFLGIPRGFSWELVTLFSVLITLHLFLSLVGCRALGLYYYHFKSRFAWSWS